MSEELRRIGIVPASVKQVPYKVGDRVAFFGRNDGYQFVVKEGEVGTVLRIEEGIYNHPYTTVKLDSGEQLSSYSYRWRAI